MELITRGFCDFSTVARTDDAVLFFGSAACCDKRALYYLQVKWPQDKHWMMCLLSCLQFHKPTVISLQIGRFYFILAHLAALHFSASHKYHFLPRYSTVYIYF